MRVSTPGYGYVSDYSQNLLHIIVFVLKNDLSVNSTGLLLNDCHATVNKFLNTVSIAVEIITHDTHSCIDTNQFLKISYKHSKL